MQKISIGRQLLSTCMLMIFSYLWGMQVSFSSIANSLPSSVFGKNNLLFLPLSMVVYMIGLTILLGFSLYLCSRNMGKPVRFFQALISKGNNSQEYTKKLFWKESLLNFTHIPTHLVLFSRHHGSKSPQLNGLPQKNSGDD
jgi:hypothetical protein